MNSVFKSLRNMHAATYYDMTYNLVNLYEPSIIGNSGYNINPATSYTTYPLVRVIRKLY